MIDCYALDGASNEERDDVVVLRNVRDTLGDGDALGRRGSDDDLNGQEENGGYE